MGAIAVAGAAVIARAGLPLSLIRPALALAYPDVRAIGASDLHALLEGPAPPTLLDARSEEEIAVSRIEGARRIDPAGGDLEGVALERPIVVYCSVGWRSASVAAELSRRGARDVRNLEDGIFGWANEQRPVYRGERAVREVHPYDRIWASFLRDDLEAYEPRQEAR